MRKVIALLLVVCIIAGLVACGKKTKDSVNDTTGATAGTVQSVPLETTVATAPTVSTATDMTMEITDDTEPFLETETSEITQAPAATTDNKPVATNTTVAATVMSSTPTIATKPDSSKSAYYGKTIEIYGLGADDSYTDYSEYNQDHQWMMRAALVEWAEINGVRLVFSGDYDQNEILSAMAAGGKPDVIFHTDKFPSNANANVVTSLTDVEYKKLADICGPGYLDMMGYRTKSFGLVLPWSANTVCYYNKTLFEKYNVKTPKEYFMEGDWTWDNFQKCIEEVATDTDADGEFDIYGLPGDSLAQCRMVNPFKTNTAGKLINTIDDPMIQAYFQFKYDVFSVSKSVISAENNIHTNVDYPLFAMQLSDCEVYKFEQLYQQIPNGDELEVVPVPSYNGEGQLQWKQSCVSLATTCDERAAAIDMLAYLLQCGMKYISDYSMGAIACDYAGVQGLSPLSAKFLKAFTELCDSRKKSVKQVRNYDEKLIAKIYETFRGAEWYTYQTYTGVTLLTCYGEITQLPLESAIPKIKPKYQAEINKYNEIYFTESKN